MAIFNKHDNKQETKKRASAETTVVATGAKLKGEFVFNCRLHVDGLVDGIITSNNLVVVGKKGCLKGELKAERLVVNGTFEGSADCKKIEVLTEGVVRGELTSEELIIESKAIFEGQSKLRTEEKEEETSLTEEDEEIKEDEEDED